MRFGHTDGLADQDQRNNDGLCITMYTHVTLISLVDKVYFAPQG